MVTTPRQPFVGFALCAVAGIASADLLAMHARLPWPVSAALTLFAFGLAGWLVRLGRSRVAVWLAVAALFFAWHAYRLGAGAGRRLAERIPSPGCVIRAVGVINEEPFQDSKVRMRLESVSFNDAPLEPCRAEVLVSLRTTRIAYGDRIEIIGSARNLRPAQNPGSFDSVAQRRRQGIFSEICVRYARDGKILAHHQASSVLAFAYRLRRAAERTLAIDLEDAPTEVALMHCMVLGSRTEESMREIEDRFQYTGAIHLYAVTGMNVVLLAGMAFWVLQALRLPRRLVFVALLPIIWLYAFATGLGASTLRATVMISIYLIGLLIERPALSWNSLGIATVAVLACQPGQLFKHGFVFSFAIVAVMMAGATPLQKKLEGLAAPDPFLPRTLWSWKLAAWERVLKFGAGWIAAGVTAWIGSIPLMLYYFHLWSPSTVPANLLGGILAFFVIGLGIGSAVAGPCCHWLAAVLNNANWFFVKGLVGVITLFSSLPGGYRFVELPWFRKAPVCEIEVLDLPAGGAIHLRVDARTFGWRDRRDWLIDCGSVTAFPRTVLPYLRSRGVNRLDGLILTHGDSKHIGGAPAVLQRLAPAEVLDSPLSDRSAHRKATHAALVGAGLGKSIVERGAVITLGRGVTLHVLFPPEGLSARSADDKALVLRLDVGPTRVLLTSDAGFITEHWLLEHAPRDELRCDLLIKGMHSKDLSGTPEFVEAVGPKVVIASSADFPPAERVGEEWVASMHSLGVRVMRLDETGAVRITLSRQGDWKAEPSK